MLEVTDYFPKVGPSDGGTEVRITGNNLDIGDNVTVILAHQKCDIVTSRYRYCEHQACVCVCV